MNNSTIWVLKVYYMWNTEFFIDPKDTTILNAYQMSWGQIHPTVIYIYHNSSSYIWLPSTNWRFCNLELPILNHSILLLLKPVKTGRYCIVVEINNVCFEAGSSSERQWKNED